MIHAQTGAQSPQQLCYRHDTAKDDSKNGEMMTQCIAQVDWYTYQPRQPLASGEADPLCRGRLPLVGCAELSSLQE